MSVHATPDQGQTSNLLAIVHRNAAGDITAVEVIARPAGSPEEIIARLVGSQER